MTYQNCKKHNKNIFKKVKQNAQKLDSLDSQTKQYRDFELNIEMSIPI